MEAPRRCPKCNRPLAPDAPEGLCPSCLLAGAPRLCRLPIWGALWAPFGLAAAYGFLAVRVVSPAAGGGPPEPESPWTWWTALGIAALVLGCAAPFACTALGFAGVARIRASAGRLYGTMFSVFVAMLYPVLAADLLLYAVFQASRRPTEVWDYLALAWALIVLVLDFLAVRAIYRAAVRPATVAAAAA